MAFPYIFWEFWRFLVPALYEKEKRTATGAVFYTSLLFLLGVGFGYYIISPLSVNFLGNYKVSESVISAPTLRSYVGTVTSVVLAAGIVFQLPILVYFLSKIGLVTPGFLKKYRRHSLVLIVTLSAIITPPDVFSQVLVALPLLILYEIVIGISKRIVREQEEEMAAGNKSAKKKTSGKAKPSENSKSGKKEKSAEGKKEKSAEGKKEKSAEEKKEKSAEGKKDDAEEKSSNKKNPDTEDNPAEEEDPYED